MKVAIFSLFLFTALHFSLYAQTFSNPGSTRAVIIGVADYPKDKDDCEFANRDAIIFHSMLMSGTLFGKPDQKNITLLVDSQATYTSIMTSLYNMIELTKENDRIIIYFSGHGIRNEIMNPVRSNILPYDYRQEKNIFGNAISENDMKDIVYTIKAKHAKCILIIDACHVGGFSNIVRDGDENMICLLACRSEEVSSNDKRWGNGMSVFTYYLMEALIGNAETDELATQDWIAINEVEKYVQDSISRDVISFRLDPQHPMIHGDLNMSLAPVVESTFIKYKKDKKDHPSKNDPRDFFDGLPEEQEKVEGRN